MDLKQLRAIGAIKDRRVVPKTITATHYPLLPESEWDEPGVPKYGPEQVDDQIDLHIRKMSSADSVEVTLAEIHLKPLVAVLRCVVDKKGNQVFPTIDDVASLEEWLFLPLYLAVNELNHLTPKHSPPKTSSGATSASPSGDEASVNGSTPSPPKSSTSGSPTGESTDASALSIASTET